MIQDQPLDFVWPLTAADRAILEAAGIKPWMLHPNTNPDSAPHPREVHRLGARLAFDEIDRVANATLFREILKDTDEEKVTRNLLHRLKCGGMEGCHEDDALGVFDFHHYRLGLWAAREYVKHVRGLMSDLQLKEDLR